MLEDNSEYSDGYDEGSKETAIDIKRRLIEQINTEITIKKRQIELCSAEIIVFINMKSRVENL